MSGVGEMVTTTKHTAMAPVPDAEPRTAAGGRRYLPRSIEVTWKHASEQAWRCGYITLYGPQIRKDGTVGRREISEALWLDADGNPNPVARSQGDPCPDWALEFHRRTMPTWGRTWVATA